MGSTPSSPIPRRVVLATSSLQALHRGGVLDALDALGAPCVPGSVARRTAAALAEAGPDRVPDLAAHAHVATLDVSDAERATAGAVAAAPRRGEPTFTWRGMRIGLPELDAVLVAARLGARLVADDATLDRAAALSGVAVLDVAQALVEMERAGRIDDARARAARILGTGYRSRRLEWLSRGAWP